MSSASCLVTLVSSLLILKKRAIVAYRPFNNLTIGN